MMVIAHFAPAFGALTATGVPRSRHFESEDRSKRLGEWLEGQEQCEANISTRRYVADVQALESGFVVRIVEGQLHVAKRVIVVSHFESNFVNKADKCIYVKI